MAAPESGHLSGSRHESEFCVRSERTERVRKPVARRFHPAARQKRALSDTLTLTCIPASDGQRREPPQIPPFSRSVRRPKTSHLPYRNIPAFPCTTGRFEKTQSGTDFEKISYLGCIKRTILPGFLPIPSLLGRRVRVIRLRSSSCRPESDSRR
jgi:hypothetical protein